MLQLSQRLRAELFSGVGKVASNAITPAPPVVSVFTSEAYEVRGKGNAPTFWRVFSSMPNDYERFVVRTLSTRCEAHVQRTLLNVLQDRKPARVLPHPGKGKQR